MTDLHDNPSPTPELPQRPEAAGNDLRYDMYRRLTADQPDRTSPLGSETTRLPIETGAMTDLRYDMIKAHDCGIHSHPEVVMACCGIDYEKAEPQMADQWIFRGCSRATALPPFLSVVPAQAAADALASSLDDVDPRFEETGEKGPA